jgi:hypothetical protein
VPNGEERQHEHRGEQPQPDQVPRACEDLLHSRLREQVLNRSRRDRWVNQIKELGISLAPYRAVRTCLACVKVRSLPGIRTVFRAVYMGYVSDSGKYLVLNPDIQSNR